MTCKSALAGGPVPDGHQNRPQSLTRLIRPADAALSRAHIAVSAGTDANTVIRLARTCIRAAARALLGRVFATAGITALQPRLAAGTPRTALNNP